jgi:hypothetical protein
MSTQSLQKIIVVTVLSLPIVSFNISSALADDQRDFTVVNNTSTTLEALFVSSSGSTTWGENVLDESIPTGASTALNYMGEASDCLFDIKGIFSDGVETEDRRVDFCKVSTYTFNDEGM